VSTLSTFFANFVLLHSFFHVGQCYCFPIYLPKFFLRSFQKSFENCTPFLKIFFGRSQILPKTFSNEVSKIRILSLEKKSSKGLLKKFRKFGLWCLADGKCNGDQHGHLWILWLAKDYAFALPVVVWLHCSAERGRVHEWYGADECVDAIVVQQLWSRLAKSEVAGSAVCSAGHQQNLADGVRLHRRSSYACDGCLWQVRCTCVKVLIVQFLLFLSLV